MALVNGPLMFNYNKIKEGALSFKEDSITFIYGSNDPSYGYIDLLKNIDNDKIKVDVVEGEDHYFSVSEDDFYMLPEKYLFYDEILVDNN